MWLAEPSMWKQSLNETHNGHGLYMHAILIGNGLRKISWDLKGFRKDWFKYEKIHFSNHVLHVCIKVFVFRNELWVSLNTNYFIQMILQNSCLYSLILIFFPWSFSLKVPLVGILSKLCGYVLTCLPPVSDEIISNSVKLNIINWYQATLFL